jgi:hypothetical protein
LPLVEITPRAIETTALGWLPPVWFYTLERWLLTGTVSEGARARIAVVALAAAATLVVVSCGWLYRSAERLAGFSGAARSGGSRGFDVLAWAQRRQLVAPETSGVLVFSILLAVLVLDEGVLLDWARVPSTCSYLPGKRVMAYTLGVLFAAYAIFVYLGAQSIRWSALHPSRTLVVGGLLLATFAALRRARMRTWGEQPLEFEDVDPAVPRALGLLPDER